MKRDSVVGNIVSIGNAYLLYCTKEKFAGDALSAEFDRNFPYKISKKYLVRVRVKRQDKNVGMTSYKENTR